MRLVEDKMYHIFISH